MVWPSPDLNCVMTLALFLFMASHWLSREAAQLAVIPLIWSKVSDKLTKFSIVGFLVYSSIKGTPLMPAKNGIIVEGAGDPVIVVNVANPLFVPFKATDGLNPETGTPKAS